MHSNNYKGRIGLFSGIDLKAPADPAATTNIDVKINNESIPIHTKIEEDTETITNNESDLSSLNSYSSINVKKSSNSRQSSSHNQQHYVSNNSGSQSRLSDLANKMSDFLLSTKQSIEVDNENLLESPNPSRTSSSASLNLLHRPKRRSFFGRNKSPSRTRSRSHTNDSNSLASPQQQTMNKKLLSSENDVKETHHVKVEYDPVTRKRVLNTYEIIKDLGAGQHGKVKLAKDLKTGKLVAIKIVDRKNKATSLERLTRKGQSQTQEDKIRKEIAIMKKCRHPHVVRLLEVLDAENSRKIYMVLEYLEKGEIRWQQLPEDLSGIQEPLLSLDETKRAFRDVVCGLEYLHHQGVIHRDIKPSNLLVDGKGNVKISDFGVSFAASLNGENEFELAKTAGTPAFLAPELCQIDSTGNVKVTHKIDIWALGVTLYCLLFGCLPFTAESEFKLFDVINHSHLKFPEMTQWIDAERLNDHDLNQAGDLLNKMLAKNPEERIDINEIKLHPFYLEGLSPEQQAYYEGAGWKTDMKIDVTNKEMNEAVVGIGGLIKKKFTDIKKALSHSTSNSTNKSTTPSTNSQSTISSNDKTLRPSGFSSMSLKDSHSYIFSEAQNTSDVIQLNLNNKIDDDNEYVNQILLPDNLTGIQNLDQTLSDVSDMGNEPEQLEFIDTQLENDIDEEKCPQEEEDYDFRKELEKSELRSNLTVNPSYASLDSYYDEGYNKFFSGSNILNSSSGGTSSPTMPGSYDRIPMAQNPGSSLSVLRGTPTHRDSPSKSMSPSVSSVLNGPGPSKRGFGVNRANMRDRILSNSNTPSSANSNIQIRPISPVIEQRGLSQNRVPFLASKKQLQKSVESSSLSSSSSGSDSDEPLMINKKSLASRRYSERRKGIPQGNILSVDNCEASICDNGDDNSDNGDDEHNDDPITIKASRSPVQHNTPKTSIYGTKINLLGKKSIEDAIQSESESDDDELILNFNRSRPSSSQLSSAQAIKMTRANILANDSICSVSNSEVVDVPDNIIASAGIDDSGVDSTPNSAGQNYAYNKILNDIAVVSINNSTDSVDQ